jgi:hypothetical protein
MRRCRWCGRFVPAGQEPTTRAITRPQMVNADLSPGSAVWSGQGERVNVQQLLCPEHAEWWSVDCAWNEPADPALPIEVR